MGRTFPDILECELFSATDIQLVHKQIEKFLERFSEKNIECKIKSIQQVNDGSNISLLFFYTAEPDVYHSKI